MTRRVILSLNGGKTRDFGQLVPYSITFPWLMFPSQSPAWLWTPQGATKSIICFFGRKYEHYCNQPFVMSLVVLCSHLATFFCPHSKQRLNWTWASAVCLEVTVSWGTNVFQCKAAADLKMGVWQQLYPPFSLSGCSILPVRKIKRLYPTVAGWRWLRLPPQSVIHNCLWMYVLLLSIKQITVTL